MGNYPKLKLWRKIPFFFVKNIIFFEEKKFMPISAIYFLKKTFFPLSFEKKNQPQQNTKNYVCTKQIISCINVNIVNKTSISLKNNCKQTTFSRKNCKQTTFSRKNY